MCENCIPRGTLCPNCGADPCYHLCFNSDAYYSPEQERADEPFYGDDDIRERYAGELVGLDDMPEDEGECMTYEYALEHGHGGGDPDDIPF